ncbi:MAG: hypothetical protein EBZ77_00185 [Chitinophagia bacterium]|nr:hypothetical protein [Chitinophagia bacterium]
MPPSSMLQKWPVGWLWIKLMGAVSSAPACASAPTASGLLSASLPLSRLPRHPLWFRLIHFSYIAPRMSTNRISRFNDLLPWLVLTAFLLAIFLSADGLHVIAFHPWSIHQWRQSDVYAYAQRFYTSGDDVFHPAAFNLAGKDGRMASEFPIIYYIGAQICRVIGFHNYVFRGLTFFCYLAGMVYLYKVARFFINDRYVAAFPVVLLASTPFFYYYGLNYLPNVPAIGISFAGLYYMLAYEQSGKRQQLIAATALFALSVVLKPTDGGIVWVAYVVARGLILLQRRSTWMQLVPLVMSSICIVAIFYAWYKYVEQYNNLYGNHGNLQSIFPQWEMKPKDIEYVYKERIYGWWLSSYQQIDILNFVKGMLYVFAITWAWQNPFLRLFTFLLVCLTWGYNILWFQAFCDHDYYQLLDVIPCAFLILNGFHWFDQRAAPVLPKWSKYVIWAGCLTLGIASVIHNADLQHFRNDNRLLVEVNPTVYAVKPYLRSLGLKPNDIIVSEPDRSPNISLAAYGYKGFSRDFFTATDLANCKAVGAKYLIINDTAVLRRADISAYLQKPMGNYRGQIFVYDLR